MLAGLALSFTDFDIYALADLANLRFVGFANYVELVQNSAVLDGLGNTLYFVGVGVPLSIAVSLGAALLLSSRLARFKAFFRTALFAPVVTTLVAVAVIWRYLFHTRYGLLNYALGGIGLRADRLARRSPLGDAGDHPFRGVEELRLQHDHLPGRTAEHPGRALRGGPHRRRLELAAVPPRNDADARAVILLVSVLTMAAYFQLFAEPYVMTQGGPQQSTVSVLYFMYEEGFKWWNLGFASAIAVHPVFADVHGHHDAALRCPA